MAMHLFPLIFLFLLPFRNFCGEHERVYTLSELDQLFAGCGGSPAEYAVRTAKNWYSRCAFYRLDLSQVLPAVELQCRSDSEARERIRRISKDIRRGLEWTLPRKELSIPFLSQEPEIDGVVSPGEYSGAAELRGEIPIDTPTAEATGEHRWFFGYDQRFLYFAVEFSDSAVRTDSIPYRADSAELFLLPEAALNSYWEVVVSPPSNRYTAWHTLGKYGLRSSFPTAPRNLKTASRRTPRGYCVEIAFPFSALPSLSESLPYPGAVLHLMACRTDLQDGGNLIFSAPVPLLYGGHNIYGYIKAVLQK